MKKAIAASLFVMAAIALLGLSAASAAEELWVVRDGKLAEGLYRPADMDPAKDPYWRGWVLCGGKTVDGLFVVERRPKNNATFEPSKSALGDCEFKAVFSCTRGESAGVTPSITITDRGSLQFSRDGSRVWLRTRKVALPLKGFVAPCPANAYDGNLHSLAVRRVGDKIFFYYDDKKLNEQPIDPDVNLIIGLASYASAPKIKSVKLTAEKFSDNLKTIFKSAAPIEKIYDGSGMPEKPEYGKAAVYRIPALAVSTKGTILAFAEARRLNFRDIGDVDAVVKRSEDNGKTWGPEVLIWDDEGRSVNNPTPVVDPKNGRIWLFMGHWKGMTATQHVAYSDDDGKTWSAPKDMTKILRDQLKPGRNICMPGPGAGIVLQRGKNAGRLVIPVNYTVGSPAWTPGVVYSDNSGATWKTGGCLLNPVMGEARCAELCDGSVLFNGRTAKKKRGLAILGNGGTEDSEKVWYADDLPDPSCQGAIARHSWPKDGKPGILLYSGPGVATARAHGTLFASYDDGKTWPWKKQYYQGSAGYSDVTALPDGRVAVLFETDGALGFTILPAPPATPKP